ncbi:MAG: PIN domain-containing protein [Opitutae bacterium]|nr:PIN domain-containing protein [Opitutae bacterium]
MIRPRIGIDTSVLVRLITGEPPDAFARCVERLNDLAVSGAEIFASNQVIGEAYIAVQHHYHVSESDARSEISKALTSGLVAPLNGSDVIAALEVSDGPGLFDRLIAEDYTRAGLEVLTLDRKMAALPDVQRL